MNDSKNFSALFEIAAVLNREFSLPAALRSALEKTVQVLNLETGWIWLLQPDNKSVYLAASYNLPPALSKHPERLSGWCFCIEKYLSDEIPVALNISEITCSRLKNIRSGTRDLKFHATIPISVSGNKTGLINLVSRESQKMDKEKLSLLSNIASLVSVTIQRTRVQESYINNPSRQQDAFQEIVDRIFTSRVEELVVSLESVNNLLDQKKITSSKKLITQSYSVARELKEQFSSFTAQEIESASDSKKKKKFQYPSSPLTAREMEVLQLIKQGLSNKQIASQLYLAERTIKFHITSILSKLFAVNRTEAINNAIQRGILS
jgi:DNA-binding NarL/FixJ family response regulator